MGNAITYQDLKDNPEIRTYIQRADQSLVALGYTNAEAVKAVKSANVTEEMDSEAVLKASLKYLAFL